MSDDVEALLALRNRRARLIQEFLDSHSDDLGVVSDDDVGDGPFMLTDWCLVLHLRDLSIDEWSGEPTEVRAAFFRPGMGYSQKLGLIAALDEGIRYPRTLDEGCDGGDI